MTNLPTSELKRLLQSCLERLRTTKNEKRAEAMRANIKAYSEELNKRKADQKEKIIEIMRNDERDGLYEA